MLLSLQKKTNKKKPKQKAKTKQPNKQSNKPTTTKHRISDQGCLGAYSQCNLLDRML